MKCDVCEKAEKLYGKPKNCQKCPAAKLKLLEENQQAWGIYCKLMGGLASSEPLDIQAITLVFNLYLDENTVVEKREIFEKISLIHRITMKNNEKQR